jgi:hypothetical protein
MAWVQSTNTQSGPGATQVTLDSTATSHQWNMAAVEILAESASDLGDATASVPPPTSHTSGDWRDWLPTASVLAACAVAIPAIIARRRRARTRAARAHEVA